MNLEKINIQLKDKSPKEIVKWALDYAKEFGGVATRKGVMDYEVVAKELEEDEVQGVNDKYDDTLNCKHCGDYYCTSKFGGECPKIQKDLFDEDDNSDLEDDGYEPFFNDEEYEKIKQAMAKRGHTPHSLGANKKGQSMAKDDLAVGAPEYTYRYV